MKPLLKGGLVGAFAVTVGGMLAGVVGALSPYAGIVGGAVVLVVLEMIPGLKGSS